MSAVQYPFIDIAVHERVREHFVRGEAMALFSLDLNSALWANGRGAALFGTPMIYDFLEQGPKRQDVTFRQLIAASARLSKTGDVQQFTIRINAGFRSVAVTARSEIIEAEPGQPAILFSTPVDQKMPSLDERVKRMIEGFDDPDIHIAVLDGRSSVVAASTGFAALGITPQTTRTLASIPSHQPGNLVKRPLPTGKGYLPAATGKLSQEPELRLLFVVETMLGRLDPVNEFAEKTNEFVEEPAQEQAPVVVSRPVETPAPIETKPDAFDDVLDAVADIEEVDGQEELDFDGNWQTKDEVIVADAVEEAPVSLIFEEESAEDELQPAETPEEIATESTQAVAQPSEETVIEPETVPATTQDVAPVAVAEPEAPAVSEAKPFVFNIGARASRFVWKIDAEGRFTSISHEFAAAVGANAAAVDGMSFSDVAALFNLDPDGKIAELLNRRDTWSGKTIFWPVENTSLVVPIDLAALPTYTRSREFDGFRGFGIVRLADAVEDPNATGLSLGSALLENSEPAPEPTDASDASAEFEPFSLPEPVVELSEEEPVAEDETLEETSEPSTESYAPPEYEVPVLDITETPARRHSDKVVQLEDRRARGRDGLSASEEAAFREIARTLKPAEPSETDADFLHETTEPAKDDVTPDPVEEVTESVLETDADSALEATAVDVAETTVDAPQANTADDDAFDAYVRGDEPIKTPVRTEASVERHIIDTSDEREPDLEQPKVPTKSRIFSSDALSAETIDQMPIALLVHIGDRLIHTNPEFLRLTGYTSVNELTEVGGLDALLQRDELENMSERPGGMVAVSAENDLIPVKARLQSVRWDDANALMLSLIPTEEKLAAAVTDDETTDAAQDEMAINLGVLKGEVEELRSILETATDGVVLLGDDGYIRSLNRSASALFNYDNDEIAGKPFVTLFAHESQRAVLDYLSGLANNGVASVLNDGREVIGREASGGFLPLFMTIGRSKSANGYCAVIRDITQWKRTEEELRNAKRAAETANAHKTDFLARVSHEIRTPLNAIIGFADMMATERFGPIGHPRYVEYSNDIGRSGRHVLDIVNDLLDISKIEAGQMDVDFTAVQLNETIAEAVSLVQPQANNQRVIIRTALSQSVPQIVADLRSIKQIVLNILSNAIRFTPSGGQIVVSTAYEPNGSVVLRIRDTGIGMTRSELEQAMKPFRQVAASSSRARGDGTGLGLPLTKAMVDANRANFSINSAPNEGTLVEISFPSQRVLAN